MGSFRDITGQKFNRLTALNYVGGSKWQFGCECGNLVTRPISHVLYNRGTGGTKSCGCLKKELDRANRKPRESELWRKFKANTKTRGLDLAISYDLFTNLVNQPCSYCCSLPLNGIDRVDNTRGYVLGNVQPCCRICNRAKREMPIRDFKTWIDRVVAFTSSNYPQYIEGRFTYSVAESMGNYKYSAKKNRLAFCLSKNDFMGLVTLHCKYCGTQPKSGINGIDRSDNKEGYTLQNAVSCCSICNRAKRDLPLTQFQSWIQAIVDSNQTGENETICNFRPPPGPRENSRL